MPPFIGGLRVVLFASALCRLARRPGVWRPRFVGWPARVSRVGRAATCGDGEKTGI